MRRRQQRSDRAFEPLEGRRLLAGDLVSRWLADDLNSSETDSIPVWVDSLSGTEARSSGTPTLVRETLGGRSAVRFDPSDDVDFFTIAGSSHALPANRFSVVIAFATNTVGDGDSGTWYTNAGLVDANTIGLGRGWGVSLAPSGQISAGLGAGIGTDPTTIYSDVDGLSDGALHVVAFTRDAGNISLYVDDQLASHSDAASSDSRDSQPITFAISNGLNVAYAGDIAEIRFYDGTLTANEVSGVHAEISAYFGNTAPQANDDHYQFEEDVSLGFVAAHAGVLTNDVDADGDPLTVELVDTTDHGALTLQPNGSFAYAPDDNFFGTDAFTYVARDFRSSQVATVTINVSNKYDAARPVEDQYKLVPDETLNIGPGTGVLANDLNPDRVTLAVRLHSDVTAGQLHLNEDGSFTYAPEGFAGTTEFSYSIDDGTQLSEASRVTLLVNTPPAAADDEYQAIEDEPLVVSGAGVLANDHDADGDVLRVSLVDDPLHGRLTLNPDGTFIYVPDPDAFGQDHFRYQAHDEIDSAVISNVTINVKSVNDAPTPVADVYYSSVGAALQIDTAAGVLANDLDIDSEAITAQSAAGPQHGTLRLNANGSFTYQPNPGFQGIDSFSYRTSDEELTSAATAVQVYVGSTPVVINEFLAANVTGIETKVKQSSEEDFPRDGLTPDWIELRNLTNGSLDLGGFYLSDDATVPEKWRIPDGTTIQPEGLQIFYASGKDISDPALDETETLHTNFSLNVRGEDVLLSYPDGRVADRIAASLQFPDQSFGLVDDVPSYLTEATPGAPNQPATEAVSAVTFSVPRGMYDQAFPVTLATPTQGAQIRFTIDGTQPSDSQGQLYTAPLQISSTTTLRAIGIRDGDLPSEVLTHTYLFADDVIRQSDAPVGYPDSWAGMPADYGMDPDVVGPNNLFDDLYRDTLQQDLKSLPSLSLVFDPEDMFGNAGLYQNPTASGDRWERPASVEFFDPKGEEAGFQLNSGLRIMGGSSRQPDIPKHSFRLEFREEFGWGKLDYPLYANAPFGDGATESFDELVIRVGFNNSWMHRHYYQSLRGEQPRDQWVRDLQFAMGQHSTRGRFAHVYLNGMYWGIYNLQERPAAPFMEDYFDGDKDTDWDVISSGTSIDGSARSWSTAHREVRNVDDPDNYETFKQQVDVTNLADYMLLNFYVGNTDWDGHNWIAAAKHGEPYRFYAWDSEFAISLPPSNTAVAENAERQIINTDKTRQNSGSNPSGLHQRLLRNDEYRMLFADRVQRHMFNSGTLTPEFATELFLARSAEIDRAVVAESARWGDFRRDVNPGRWRSDQFDLYHRDEHYLNQKEFIVERYLPVRTDIVLTQLRRARVFPEIAAPVFSQHGGRVSSNFQLAMAAADDVTIYYTLDGQDPRQVGGAVHDAAQTYMLALALTENVVVKARALKDGEWSALSEAEFRVAEAASADNLRISEIHYHPADPSQAEIENGVDDADEFEFIELVNISDQPVDLSNVRFVQEQLGGETHGVDFDFAESAVSQLPPQEFIVVVENVEAFQLRYGSEIPIAGQWRGGLSNAGEILKLVAGELTIHRFGYDDAWQRSTDGGGFSLVARQPTIANLNLWNEAGGWRPSTAIGGSPGAAEVIAGDVNHDGLFDSSDLVSVFQAAEYEDGVENNSTFEEGDWNHDGDFTSADLVLVFRLGHFQQAQAIFGLDADEGFSVKERKRSEVDSRKVDRLLEFEFDELFL